MTVKKFGNVEGAPEWNISVKHVQQAHVIMQGSPEEALRIIAAYVAGELVTKDEGQRQLVAC